MKIALMAASLSRFCWDPRTAARSRSAPDWFATRQKQVEEFVAFSDADPRTAISANNEENDRTACAVVNIAFVSGHHTITARTRHATFQIADILVIGVITDGGIQYVTLAVQFSLFHIDERKA